MLTRDSKSCALRDRALNIRCRLHCTALLYSVRDRYARIWDVLLAKVPYLSMPSNEPSSVCSRKSGFETNKKQQSDSGALTHLRKHFTLSCKQFIAQLAYNKQTETHAPEYADVIFGRTSTNVLSLVAKRQQNSTVSTFATHNRQLQFRAVIRAACLE